MKIFQNFIKLAIKMLKKKVIIYNKIYLYYFIENFIKTFNLD